MRQSLAPISTVTGVRKARHFLTKKSLSFGAPRQSYSINAAPPVHIPVLLSEFLSFTAPLTLPSSRVKKNDSIIIQENNGQRIYVDGTFGGGGYTKGLLDQSDCLVIAIDQDPCAIQRAHELAAKPEYANRLFPVHGNFKSLPALLDPLLHRLGRQADAAKIDGFVMDIGVSSPQIDDPSRGFSYRQDGPLNMCMASGSASRDASTVVNTSSQAKIERILRCYGEERLAAKIARAIVTRRKERPFLTTRALSDLVAQVYGRPDSNGPKHPAAKTFQALRIYVNDELNALKQGLIHAEQYLSPGGFLAGVSFHSLEDRLIKTFLTACSKGEGIAEWMSDELLQDEILERRVPLPWKALRRAAIAKKEEAEALGIPLKELYPDSVSSQRPLDPSFTLPLRKPIIPGREEMKHNPRSRSAKLRTAIRTDHPPLCLNAY